MHVSIHHRKGCTPCDDGQYESYSEETGANAGKNLSKVIIGALVGAATVFGAALLVRKLSSYCKYCCCETEKKE